MVNIYASVFQTFLLAISGTVLLFFIIATVVLVIFTVILRRKYIAHYKKQYRGN